jgi:hypothetical protein
MKKKLTIPRYRNGSNSNTNNSTNQKIRNNYETNGEDLANHTYTSNHNEELFHPRRGKYISSGKAVSNKSQNGSQTPQNQYNTNNSNHHHQMTFYNNSNLFNSFNKTITYESSPIHGNFTDPTVLNFSVSKTPANLASQPKPEEKPNFNRLFDFPSIS